MKPWGSSFPLMPGGASSPRGRCCDSPAPCQAQRGSRGPCCDGVVPVLSPQPGRSEGPGLPHTRRRGAVSRIRRGAKGSKGKVVGSRHPFWCDGVPCRGVPEPPWSLGKSASEGAALCQTLRFTVQLSDLCVSTQGSGGAQGRPRTEWFASAPWGRHSHPPELPLPATSDSAHSCGWQVAVPCSQSQASKVTAAEGKDTASLRQPSRTGFCLLLHRQLNVVMEEHFIKHIQLTSNEMINFSFTVVSNVCLLFFFFLSNQHQKVKQKYHGYST